MTPLVSAEAFSFLCRVSFLPRVPQSISFLCGGINEALPFHPEFSWLIAPHGATPHHFNFKWSLPMPPVLANKCSLAEMRAVVGDECRHLLITAPFVRGDASLLRRNAALTTRREEGGGRRGRSEMCCFHLSPALHTLNGRTRLSAFMKSHTFSCLATTCCRQPDSVL